MEGFYSGVLCIAYVLKDIYYSYFEISLSWVGDMVLCLRTLAALTENHILDPETSVRWLTTICYSSSRGALKCSYGIFRNWHTLVETRTYTHTHK